MSATPAPSSGAPESGTARVAAWTDEPVTSTTIAAAIEDPTRLSAVRATHLLDAPASPTVHRLVTLAARLLRAPAALLTLVDGERDVIKAAVGLPADVAAAGEIRAFPSFCQIGVSRHQAGRVVPNGGPGAGALLVVGDATADPVFGATMAGLPGVAGLGVRACVTAPLLDADGQAVGSLCVIDFATREWTEGEMAALADIAAAAAGQIALHASNAELTQANELMQQQAVELELQTQQMQEQQVELEISNQQLHETLVALEQEGAARLASEARFRVAQEVSPDGFGILRAVRDADGVVTDFEYTYVNAAAERMLGREAGSLAGRRMLTEFPGRDRTTRLAAYVRVVDTGEPFRAEFGDEENGVPTRVFQVSAVRLDDGVAVTLADVTERRRAERAAIEGERQFRTLATAGAFMVWYAAPDGAVRGDSPGWEAFTGQTPAEYHGYGWLDALHPDDVAPSRAGWGAALAGRRSIDMTFRVRRRDGSYGHVRARGTPVLDDTGRVQDWVGTCADVTEWALAEAARSESERQFRTLADAIPTLAWTARADGWIDWYNARWYAYTGTTPDEMTGWGWQSVHDPAVLPDVMARWSASIASGEPFEMEFPLRAAEGTFCWFLTRVHPVRDAEGRVARWFGTNTDVQALRDARAEAERANRAKSDFLATMSHELRTPLNAVTGYAELMALGIRGPVTPEQLDDLGRIRRSSDHLLGLINSILNFAKLEAGQIEVRRAAVDVAGALADAAALVGPQTAARGLTLSLEAPRVGPVDGPNGEAAAGGTLRACADPEQLRQILLNLLTNAVKFTEAGGAVRVSASGDAARVRIHVRDTGRGIPADQLDRIFEPFVQVDRHLTQQSQQGVGLGLAISRELARGMGGDLAVESRAGEGSTFTVTLERVVEADGGGAGQASAALLLNQMPVRTR